MNIVIILSTYNGSSYIREQVQSIRDQSYESWILLIRDDGSTDSTMKILQEITATDKRISILDDDKNNIGPAQSFNILANEAMKFNADYLMFCDQDDYWEPLKIQETLKLAQSAERTYSTATPVLVHTDLEVVDTALDNIYSSYLKHQHMHDAKEKAVHILLSQNYITGCTIMANKALISVAQPIPECAIMHDWWYGLCASVTGVIAFSDKPTIKYRQHQSNVYGSAGFISMLFSKNLFRQYFARKKRNYIYSFQQNRCLRDRLFCTEYKTRREYQLLDDYCSASTKNGIYRLGHALRMGIRQQGLLRNLFYYYSLLFIRP